MRKRLSYANVTATLPLVFAMSGVALAAHHYLINSTKQINPKVLKVLKGKTGKEGPAGKEGLTGKEGKEGLAGKEGSPAVVLAKGQTELGTYATWGVGGGYLGTNEDYRIPLSGPLHSTH